MAKQSILVATNKSIKAAQDALGPIDAGPIAALQELARQLDYMAENGGLREDGKLDNVSMPTYLRFCESLGLTPAGRTKLKPKEQETGGKLAQLRSISKRPA